MNVPSRRIASERSLADNNPAEIHLSKGRPAEGYLEKGRPGKAHPEKGRPPKGHPLKIFVLLKSSVVGTVEAEPMEVGATESAEVPLAGVEVIWRQMLTVPDIPGLAGYKVLLAQAPPYEHLDHMECLGAVCLWLDADWQIQNGRSQGGWLGQALCLGQELFPDVVSEVFVVDEYCRKIPPRPATQLPVASPAAQLSDINSADQLSIASPAAQLPDFLAQLATPGFVWVPFMKRLDEISHEEFVVRWREGHWPLVQRHHPGVCGYTQNIIQNIATANQTWDGISELHFATPQDMRYRIYDSEEGKRIIRQDVSEFMNPAAGQRFYAKEVFLRHP